MKEFKQFSTSVITLKAVNIEDCMAFSAPHLATALGYKNVEDLYIILDKEDICFCSTEIAKELGFESPVGFIKESGLYTAILFSNNNISKKLKRWLAVEVLPCIRQSGEYPAWYKSPNSCFIASMKNGLQQINISLSGEYNPNTKIFTLLKRRALR